MTVLNLLAALDLSPLPQVGANGDSSPIQIILTLVWTVFGAVCLLIITIAGLKLILAQGDPQQINKSKNSIIYAAIGLGVSVMAATIVGFIFSRI